MLANFLSLIGAKRVQYQDVEARRKNMIKMSKQLLPRSVARVVYTVTSGFRYLFLEREHVREENRSRTLNYWLAAFHPSLSQLV